MSDDVGEADKDNSGEPDPIVANDSQEPAENTTESENTETVSNAVPEEVQPSQPEPSAEESNLEATPADAEGNNTEPPNDQETANNLTDTPTDSNKSDPADTDVEHEVPLTDNVETKENVAASEQQPAAAAEVDATETLPIDDVPKDTSQSSDEQAIEEPPPITEAVPPETEDVKVNEDKTSNKSPEPSIAQTHDGEESTLTDGVKEETVTDVFTAVVEASSQAAKDVPNQADQELQELEELVKKASEGLSQKKSKTENASLTKCLYEEQIKTGKLNRLTSVVEGEDGIKRLVRPGSVPHWNTISISLAGKRSMPSERCRKGEHNCFESSAARRERALSAGLAQGLYPDFMRLNPKLNEFVAASILEKLRLKGLAAPLHLYKGRYLPSDILAEMVLKPKKKKVTDRYYFGYVPPPNRPRISTEFRRYLQRFSERHRAEESDLCYSHAMKRVRKLAGQHADHLTLPQTLAEVVRAQEEPGFGVKRLRRPHTAII